MFTILVHFLPPRKRLTDSNAFAYFFHYISLSNKTSKIYILNKIIFCLKNKTENPSSPCLFVENAWHEATIQRVSQSPGVIE
jgi:hypothetical protein